MRTMRLLLAFAIAAFGLSLRAVKGNPLRSALIGISVNGRLVAVYTLAAFYAGVAGALVERGAIAVVHGDVAGVDRGAVRGVAVVTRGVGHAAVPRAVAVAVGAGPSRRD